MLAAGRGRAGRKKRITIWRMPVLFGIMHMRQLPLLWAKKEEEGDMVPVHMESLVVLIVVGLIAGWLAGLITQGAGFGVFGNIIVGIVGAFIGFYLLGYLNISLFPGRIGDILTATLGSVILIFIVGLLRR